MFSKTGTERAWTTMHLVQILLPLADDDGRSFSSGAQ